MGVTFIYPQGSDKFPKDDTWTAKVAIDSSDVVDGMLLDCTTNNPYPSNNPTDTGNHHWNIPFAVHQITKGDPLLIFCYDAETLEGGSSCMTVADRAAQFKPSQTEQPSPPDDGSAIHIGHVDPPGPIITVNVTLQAGKRGGIFLLFANFKDPKSYKHDVQGYPLLESSNENRSHKFRGIDEKEWTHIYVVAISGCSVEVRPIKTPRKK